MTATPSPDSSTPRHVAIVADGNGRWASKRFMPRGVGHKAGVDSLVNVVRACVDRGIPYLTVFAFSSENWKRPEEEVSGLMNLLIVALSKHLIKLKSDGVRIRVVGDSDQVSDKVRQALNDAERATQENDTLVLTVAFNYGGRWDIVQVCRRAMEAGVTSSDLSEATLSRFMAMAYAPDPDLFIRTGARYVCLISCCGKALTPSSFHRLLVARLRCGWLDRSLAEFARRERRFGGVMSESGNTREGA